LGSHQPFLSPSGRRVRGQRERNSTQAFQLNFSNLNSRYSLGEILTFGERFVHCSPSGGTLFTNQQLTFPFEVWRCQCIEPFGKNFTEVFVDPSNSGAFHLADNSYGIIPFQSPRPFGLRAPGFIPVCGNELFADRLPPPTQLDRFTKVNILTRIGVLALTATVATHLSVQLRFANQRNPGFALHGYRFQAIGGSDSTISGRKAAQQIEDGVFAGRGSNRTGLHTRTQEMASALSRFRRE
jgi:hypothetical protein